MFKDMETWFEIRRRVLTGEISKRGACKEYRVRWRTLQRTLKHEEPAGYQMRQSRRKRKIEKFLPIIHKILEQDQQAPKKQRHTAQRIFERLQDEHEYDGMPTIVKDAVRMAVEQRRPGAGLLHHSDRGSQYAADAFTGLLARHQIVCSMSRKGNCWDNAPAERFFGKLKTERVYGQHYATREEAKLDLLQYIELFYHRKRRHASLGYLSPVAFEERYLKSQSPQAA